MTTYRLELLEATAYLQNEKFISINNDAIELMKMLTSIIKTTKKNTNN